MAVGPDSMESVEELMWQLEDFKEKLYYWIKIGNNRLDGIESQLANMNRNNHDRFEQINRCNRILNDQLCQQQIHMDRQKNILSKIRRFLGLK